MLNFKSKWLFTSLLTGLSTMLVSCAEPVESTITPVTPTRIPKCGELAQPINFAAFPRIEKIEVVQPIVKRGENIAFRLFLRSPYNLNSGEGAVDSLTGGNGNWFANEAKHIKKLDETTYDLLFNTSKFSVLGRYQVDRMAVIGEKGVSLSPLSENFYGIYYEVSKGNTSHCFTETDIRMLIFEVVEG